MLQYGRRYVVSIFHNIPSINLFGIYHIDTAAPLLYLVSLVPHRHSCTITLPCLPCTTWARQVVGNPQPCMLTGLGCPPSRTPLSQVPRSHAPLKHGKRSVSGAGSTKLRILRTCFRIQSRDSAGCHIWKSVF